MMVPSVTYVQSPWAIGMSTAFNLQPVNLDKNGDAINSSTSLPVGDADGKTSAIARAFAGFSSSNKMTGIRKFAPTLACMASAGCTREEIIASVVGVSFLAFMIGAFCLMMRANIKIAENMQPNVVIDSDLLQKKAQIEQLIKVGLDGTIHKDTKFNVYYDKIFRLHVRLRYTEFRIDFANKRLLLNLVSVPEEILHKGLGRSTMMTVELIAKALDCPYIVTQGLNQKFLKHFGYDYVSDCPWPVGDDEPWMGKRLTTTKSD